MSEENKDKVFTQEEVNALLAKEKGKVDESVIKERDQYKTELEKFKKVTEAGLKPEYAKFIQNDEDIEFFKNEAVAVKETQTKPPQRFVDKPQPKDAADAWAQEVEGADED